MKSAQSRYHGHRYLAELEDMKIKRLPDRDDAVLLIPDSKPWKSWKTAYRNALKAAGNSDFTFHDLRHCFSSYQAMADVNEKARMELMGHKRPETTMRYTHLSLDYKRAAVAQLEKLGCGVPTNLPIASSDEQAEALRAVESKVR